MYGHQLEDLERCFEFPVYHHEVDGASFTWTLDIFNPNNEEMGLKCYDVSKEYIELVVDRRHFRPHGVRLILSAADKGTTMKTQSALNVMLTRVWMEISPQYIFGSADMHLLFLPYISRRLYTGLQDLYWPWSIRRMPFGAEDRYSEKAARLPYDEWHPNRGLHFETLSDGAVLTYSIETCPEDERLYAEIMEQKSVLANFKRRGGLPDAPPW